MRHQGRGFVRRRRACAITALLLATVGAIAPQAGSAAGAAVAYSLTPAGSVGRVLVRPVAANGTGAIVPLTGNPADDRQNPNRIAGYTDVLPPNGNGPACSTVPETADCFRGLLSNSTALNASASDGHTHYHAGDQVIAVNEIKDFRRGDVIMVGSPHCDFARLGTSCRKLIDGVVVDEQPAGEIAYVAGGDAFEGSHGTGVIVLADPLMFAHPEGTQVAKLPTAYTGPG
jgi:hypothetical protein